MNETLFNITSFQDFLTTANQYGTHNLMGVGILLFFYTIGVAQLNKKYTFPIANFLTLTLLVPIYAVLYALTLVPKNSFLVFIFIIGISGVFAWYKRKTEVYV